MSGSNEDENETHGGSPKVGVSLSLDQADLIIQRHLPDFRAAKISHINRGYNNRVYIVTVRSISDPNNCEEQTYIIRLSGRFWTRYKTENEVCAILYMKKYGGIPVPTIYGYCTDKQKSGVDGEYILMERLKGESLDDFWDELSLQEKKYILDQLVQIVCKIKQINFDQIGSFQFDEETGKSCGLGVVPTMDIEDPKSAIRIGQGVEFDGGPCDTFLEYFKNLAKTEIKRLRECPFMKESDGYDSRLKRVERFVQAFENVETIPVGIDREALNCPFVFTHGDLEPRNILGDRATLQVTGVVDWEFAGAYPIDDEWFSGFGFVNSDTSVSRVLNDGLPLEENNVLDQSGPEEANLLREYFLQSLRDNQVSTPDEIPGHMIRAELFYFQGYICPWWLREEREPSLECHNEDRQRACEIVDAILGKYGF